MCTVGGAALPDDIAMEDDPAYYKHNKHIKQCAPPSAPHPSLAWRCAWCWHRAPSPLTEPHRASPATAHLAPRLTCHHRASWHRLAWHRASPGTGTSGTTPRVAPRSNHDVEDIYRHWDALVDRSDLPALNEIVTDLVADTPRTERGLEQALLRDRPKPKPKPNPNPNPKPNPKPNPNPNPTPNPNPNPDQERVAKYSTLSYRAPEMVDLYRKHEVG